MLSHSEERLQVHRGGGGPVFGIGLQELPDLPFRENGGRPEFRLRFTPASVQLLKRHAPHRINRIRRDRFGTGSREFPHIRCQGLRKFGESLRRIVRHRGKVERPWLQARRKRLETFTTSGLQFGVRTKAEFAGQRVLRAFQLVERRSKHSDGFEDFSLPSEGPLLATDQRERRAATNCGVSLAKVGGKVHQPLVAFLIVGILGCKRDFEGRSPLGDRGNRVEHAESLRPLGV